jgi:predicted MFS family arabinose efflux permease
MHVHSHSRFEQAALPLAALGVADGASYPAALIAACIAYAPAAAFNVLFGAWLFDEVRPATAATQLALLAAVHNLSYVAAGPIAGMGAEALGFPMLYVLAAAGTVPALLLCILNERRVSR